jgi:iron(III) transport system substrate-binding protein
MIVAEEFSKNVNTEAAEAVASWLLTEEAQRVIMQGYMHSVLKGMAENPAGSVDTEQLIGKDLGVNWEKAYRERQEILKTWAEKVTR